MWWVGHKSLIPERSYFKAERKKCYNWEAKNNLNRQPGFPLWFVVITSYPYCPGPFQHGCPCFTVPKHKMSVFGSLLWKLPCSIKLWLSKLSCSSLANLSFVIRVSAISPIMGKKGIPFLHHIWKSNSLQWKPMIKRIILESKYLNSHVYKIGITRWTGWIIWNSMTNFTDWKCQRTHRIAQDDKIESESSIGTEGWLFTFSWHDLNCIGQS